MFWQKARLVKYLLNNKILKKTDTIIFYNRLRLLQPILNVHTDFTITIDSVGILVLLKSK